MKKFSAGGAQGRYDRRMADIEKDFKKAMARKTGKDAEVAEAKRQQRIADAKDDLAKRTGADRTATRAAESAAERNLTLTRKFGAPKAVTAEAPVSKVVDSMPALTAPKMDSSIGKPQSFAAAFKDAFRRQTAAKQAELRREANRAAMRRNTAGKTQLVGPADSQEARIRTAQKTMAAVKPVDDKAAKLSRLKVAAEAPGATQFAKDRYKYAVSSGMYAKGGKVKKKETTMKYAKGGSTSPRPVPKKPMPKEPITGGANTVPLTPERKEFLKELAKRNAKPGMAKGGKAPKFGAAMVKKSADTKGRAMVKKAGGGKCYASGGLVAGHKSADGIAKKGKTKGKMPTMKKGGYC